MKLVEEQKKLRQTQDLRNAAQDQLKLATNYADQQQTEYNEVQKQLQTLQAQDQLLSSQTAALESQKSILTSRVTELDLQLSKEKMEVADAHKELIELSRLTSALPRSMAPLSAPVPTTNIAHGTLVIYADGVLNLPAKLSKGQLPYEVYINGSPYAFVVPETFFSVHMTPGDYTVCIATPFSPCAEGVEEVPVSLRNGATVYLRVTPAPDGTKYQPSLDHTSQAERVKLAPKPIPQDKVIDEAMVIRSSN